MNTVIYLLCMLVLIQLVFSILIYDMVLRRYKKMEDVLEEMRHEKCYREGLMSKIIFYYKSKDKDPDKHALKYINKRIEELWELLS